MSRKQTPGGETPPPEAAPRRRGRPSTIGEVRPHQKPLRVTERDEALMALLRPYMAGVTNESEQAYTLVREGLLMRLAALAALGVGLDGAVDEEVLAAHAAQQLLLVLPLLRRTGRLALLGMEMAAPTLTDTNTSRVVPDGDPLDVDDMDEQAGRDAEGLSGGLI
jgi:hypothetical protein